MMKLSAAVASVSAASTTSCRVSASAHEVIRVAGSAGEQRHHDRVQRRQRGTTSARSASFTDQELALQGGKRVAEASQLVVDIPADNHRLRSRFSPFRLAMADSYADKGQILLKSA
jgi:hypothetical protein